MKETIIFAPGLNGTELLRSLARFGRNTFGYRICNAVDLSGIALMKSGIAVTERFLPRKDEAAVIDTFLRDIPYFTTASYADAESMAAALYTLRSLIPENEYNVVHDTFPKGEFPEKNEGIITVYDRYMDMLSTSGRIDTVGMIRKALAETGRLTDDTKILTLKEYPLTPLEQKLSARLAAGEVRETSLTELFHADTKTLHGIIFTECYGASNEVRDIISYICQNHIPLDHCTIAVTETLSYAELINDLSGEYDIPVSFGCGLPITVSNPARLLKLYQNWNGSGFRGIDALSALIMSSAFDRQRLSESFPGGNSVSREDWKEIIQTAGSLRLSANKDDNAKKLSSYRTLTEDREYKNPEEKERALFILSCTEILSREMEKSAVHLIQNYTKIRENIAGRIDRSAVTVIIGLINAYLAFSGKKDIDEIIPAILSKTVSSENSREGTLHVCGISGAMAVPREYLFVAGLSSSNFPGSPSENYLLLDSDLRLFGKDPEVPTSVARVLKKKQSLMDLMQEASDLDLKIRLSYSSYDLAELKEENPSSVLQEIFDLAYPLEREEDAFQKALLHAAFFEDGISKHTCVGETYIHGDSICPDIAPVTAGQSASAALNTEWSPSAIDDFFDCPRKFYLTRILRIEEPEPDDPFEVINAKEVGTMAHRLMEQLGSERPDKTAFLKQAGVAFDRWLISRPPVHEDDGERERQQFLRMMKNAFEQDPGRTVVSSEERKHVTHPLGIRLQGIPDRVERMQDGSGLIVDFKTGRRVTHKQDDIETCLQVLIYAYMTEQEGIPVSGCEYRYLRNKKTVTCRYDAEMKKKLDERLSAFKDALLSGSFPCTGDKDNCRFCRLDTICGRERKTDGEDGDE